MAKESVFRSAPVAVNQTTKAGAKASGVIVYNKFLDAWRCIDAKGKCVLSTGSKATARAEFPNFIVKE